MIKWTNSDIKELTVFNQLIQAKGMQKSSPIMLETMTMVPGKGAPMTQIMFFLDLDAGPFICCQNINICIIVIGEHI